MCFERAGALFLLRCSNRKRDVFKKSVGEIDAWKSVLETQNCSVLCIP